MSSTPFCTILKCTRAICFSAFLFENYEFKRIESALNEYEDVNLLQTYTCFKLPRCFKLKLQTRRRSV